MIPTFSVRMRQMQHTGTHEASKVAGSGKKTLSKENISLQFFLFVFNFTLNIHQLLSNVKYCFEKNGDKTLRFGLLS